MDSGATESMTAPARTRTRSQGSTGSPSSRVRYAYSPIGVSGSAGFPFGRTGATTSAKPCARALSRVAASIRPDRPSPCRSRVTLISMALTVSGRIPARRSAKAHIRTWSQPRAGSSPPRPSACRAKGTLNARAITASPSVATNTYSAGSVTIHGYSSEDTGSWEANAGHGLFMSQSRSAGSGRWSRVVLTIPVMPGGQGGAGVRLNPFTARPALRAARPGRPATAGPPRSVRPRPRPRRS